MTFICHPELVSGSCKCSMLSLGLRFAPVGISRRCARLSYVAIVVHGPCSPQAPIAPHVWYGLRALCQAHRLPPSHSTHLIVFSACAIKIAPFTSLALRSQRRLGTVSQTPAGSSPPGFCSHTLWNKNVRKSASL